jgi:riboflavin-specific deaminase-like protein
LVQLDDVRQLPVMTALDAARRDDRPFVVAQLGQSLDGRIATPSGHSHFVNGPAAIRLLHEIRARVDAVLVGSSTAVADDPQLTVRHCPGRDPARVLIDRRRRAGARLRMFREGVPRIVFGPPLRDDPPGVEAVPPPGGDASPAFVLGELARRGHRRLLVEGGADTVSRFLAAGRIDRLCLLIGPLLIGSGPIGVNLPAIATLDGALRPPVTMALLEGGDIVADCDLGALR